MEVGVKTIGENIINKLPDKRPNRVLTQQSQRWYDLYQAALTA